MQRHSSERPFLCHVCSFSFAVFDGLKNHMKTHERDGGGKITKGRNRKPRTCRLCSFVATTKLQLDSHFDESHPGEKPFKCETCDYTTRLEHSLRTHTYTHTGDRPYKCDECESAFTQWAHLRRHKLVHSGEKPFKCDLCSFRTAHSGNLNSHKKVLHPNHQENS